MNLQEVKQAAREKMKGYCRVCKECNGVVCAGEVPGMGGVGTGSSFTANIEALAKKKLILKTLHNAKNPDITTDILGMKLTMPILAAPVTGSEYNMGGAISEADYAQMIITGSRNAGTIGMCGDGGNPLFYDSGLEAIKKENGHGIGIIKPRENSIVIDMANRAKDIGAAAVGMDVDGAGLVTMALMGQPVGPKNKEELIEIISSVDMPFILKGIMTLEEAKLAYEVGASAIVVSNHGGRVLDSTPGVADVLPDIAKEMKGKITIFADGGVRSGVDVLKYLALGADAVLVGRPVIVGAFGGGEKGVQLVLDTMAKELKQAMILTGCENLEEIKPSILF
ncbi:MAG TPA: alpha-hydroxy-acid oxidizing protein [Thermoanaerobacterales bacterium]|nr:alpha-hydroxy-acid oxidizing protein [Thermoanaerobacterales bacterium]